MPGMELREVTWVERMKILAFCLLMAVCAGVLAAAPANASTFTVNSATDPGDGTCDATGCTLREAINAANANNNDPTIDTITFNASGEGCDPTSGVCTISPTSELPTITDPVIINGYTQGDGTANDAKPNTLAVGDNAVLKIELSGVNIPPPGPSGSTPSGLRIEVDNSKVKGLIISKWDNGVFLGTDANGNKVTSNFIGTDASGTNLGNTIGVASIGDDNTIGGTTPAARNIISNNGAGVQIGSLNGGNKVQGNYIGTDKNGTAELGNNDGVVIQSSPDNTIGGTTPAARNIISGNGTYGIWIAFPDADRNKVQGNYIGTGVTGTSLLGNGLNGVEINGQASDNTVGGRVTDTSNPRNVISGNGKNGIEVNGFFDTAGNSILSNSIYANGALGIDLINPNDPAGVTPNDDGDADGGANGLQNYPVITSARTGRKATTIKGTLNSYADTSFTLQFFVSPEADSSTYGEGKTFRLKGTVTTDSSGNASFTFKSEKKIPKDQVVTATATNRTTGDTSEFSAAVLVS